MHEYSIVRTLLDRVEAEARQHRAQVVHRIHVRLGELAGVELDLLRSAFEMFREGTACDGADLEIQPVVALWVCPSCDRPFAAGDVLRCPRCAVPAALSCGDEIFLDRIEMEVADV